MYHASSDDLHLMFAFAMPSFTSCVACVNERWGTKFYCFPAVPLLLLVSPAVPQRSGPQVTKNKTVHEADSL